MSLLTPTPEEREIKPGPARTMEAPAPTGKGVIVTAQTPQLMQYVLMEINQIAKDISRGLLATDEVVKVQLFSGAAVGLERCAERIRTPINPLLPAQTYVLNKGKD